MGTAIEEVAREHRHECVSLGHSDIEITDWNALESVVERLRPDLVINSAAIVGVNPCEQDPQRAFRVNSLAVRDLARLCQEREIRLVQTSTNAVFDGTQERPYEETDRPNPKGVYSVSKYAGECFATFCERHIIVRFPTLYGPRRNRKVGFVDKMMNDLREGRELKIAEDKIDSPTYSRDAAARVLSILEMERPFGLYHVANDGAPSYFEFVRFLAERLGSASRLTAARDRDFEALGPKPLRTALRTKRLQPLRDWREALTDYLSHL